MKTKQEIKEWLLRNCLNEDGNLDLSHLDFTDFNGDVYIDNMKVKKNLCQSFQEVSGNLSQCYQNVSGDLQQSWQNVSGDLQQDWQVVDGNLQQKNQTVRGNFITQTLKGNEECKIKDGETYIVKKIKELTKEEIEELLGYEIKIIEKER